MPLPRRRRVAAAILAALVADAGVALITQLPAGAVRARGDETTTTTAKKKKKKAAATLQILSPNVSVRRKGEDEFAPAEEGQKLFVGDTVKTDANGFAEIDYTDAGDTYTRLDVDTEFTIVSITDDEGNRQVSGSLDVGRTWNRTSALTESEEFEQEGAGATAAVVGSVFFGDCYVIFVDGAFRIRCVWTSFVHGLQVTTEDDEVVDVQELESCDATEVTDTNSDLCDEPGDADLTAFLNDAFVAKNYLLDRLGGYTDLPDDGFSLAGMFTVDNGEVTNFESTTTPTTTTTTQTTTPTTQPPVAVDHLDLHINAAAVNVGGSTTGTVTVKDASNVGIAGLTITFTCSGGSPSCDLTFVVDTDHGDGTYSFTVTSHSSTGVMAVVAHANGVDSESRNLNVNNPSS